MATTDHNEITLTKRNQSKVVRPLALSSRTAQTEQPHNFMIIANAIFYNGQSADRIYLNGAKVWEKETTPPTPTYGSNVFAGKFTDSSTESYWKFWPNGQTGNGTSIKQYVDPETKEFNFDYNTPLTSCKYLLNGNGSNGRFERIDHIPDTSEVTTMEMMFANSSSLTSVNVSDLDTSKVTTMDSMFAHCQSLTSLDISGWDVSRVNDMYSMFYKCIALQSLDLSGWDVSRVNDMRYMFSDCRALQSLDLSGWDVSSVTSINTMFNYCQSLTTVLGPISGIKFNLGLSDCPFTNASAMVFINGLSEVSEAKTITFKSTTYDQLTPEQIAVATSKGWNVVRS